MSSLGLNAHLTLQREDGTFRGAGDSWTRVSEYRAPFCPGSRENLWCWFSGDPSQLQGCCPVSWAEGVLPQQEGPGFTAHPISVWFLAVWGFFWNACHGAVSSGWPQLSEGHVHGELLHSLCLTIITRLTPRQMKTNLHVCDPVCISWHSCATERKGKKDQNKSRFSLPRFLKVVNCTWLSFSEAIWQGWWFVLENWRTRRSLIASTPARRGWTYRWLMVLAKVWR